MSAKAMVSDSGTAVAETESVADSVARDSLGASAEAKPAADRDPGENMAEIEKPLVTALAEGNSAEFAAEGLPERPSSRWRGWGTVGRSAAGDSL